jgi:hypothetical protein
VSGIWHCRCFHTRQQGYDVRQQRPFVRDFRCPPNSLTARSHSLFPHTTVCTLQRVSTKFPPQNSLVRLPIFLQSQINFTTTTNFNTRFFPANPPLFCLVLLHQGHVFPTSLPIVPLISSSQRVAFSVGLARQAVELTFNPTVASQSSHSDHGRVNSVSSSLVN